MTKPKIPGVRLHGTPPKTLFVEVGQRIGRCVVIDAEIRIPTPGQQYRPRGARGVRLLCEICGNEFVTTIYALLGSNRSRGCGCGKKKPKFAIPNRATRNAALGSYKRSAEKRGFSWELTGEDFDRMTSQECHYCGAPPGAVWKAGVKYTSGDFIYTGLDRKDSALGYTLENVVPCCKTCNYAKRSMSYDDFMQWIARLIAYHWFNPQMTPSSRLKAVI